MADNKKTVDGKKNAASVRRMREKNQAKTVQKAPPGTAKRVLSFLGGYRGMLILSLLCTAVSVILTLYIPLIFGRAIDTVVSVGNVDFDTLFDCLIKSGIAIGVCAVFSWCMGLINNRIAFGVVKDIRRRAFEHINVLPLKFLDSVPTGNTVSRVISDVDTFADGLLIGFTQFFSGVLTIIGTLAVLIKLSPLVAVVVAALTPASLFVAKYIASHSYRYFKNQTETKAHLTEITDEVTSNLKTVKAFNCEKQQQSAYENVNGELRTASLKAVFYSSLTNPCTRFVNALVYAAAAFAGAAGIIAGGSLTVGLLTSVLSYANKYTKPFNEISSVFAELQNALCCAARVIELINEPAEPPDKADAETLPNSAGNVKIENLSFSYNKETELIKDFCLDVKKGSRVAIVGPTGCGKTTVINLLMRFYDADSGCIYIDGKSIYSLSRRALRSNYGMVLQETWLKSGTVRENIAMGKPDATIDEIINAAKLSHAHSFIKRLPNGYDTFLTEDGGTLSQGQKQLLCIARVMLSSPGVLILDEATSSIDTVTEQRVQKAFASLTKGRTSFVVAHRLSTIMSADVILVMDKGRIIEQGTHTQLLNKNGFYARLWNSM